MHTAQLGAFLQTAPGNYKNISQDLGFTWLTTIQDFIFQDIPTEFTLQAMIFTDANYFFLLSHQGRSSYMGLLLPGGKLELLPLYVKSLIILLQILCVTEFIKKTKLNGINSKEEFEQNCE